MTGDGVTSDGFFVEEHLCCLLGVPGDAHLRSVVRLSDYPAQLLTQVGAVIQDARNAGIKLSNYTAEFGQRLGFHLQASAASSSSSPGPLPEGWEEANDPATGNPYYFNRATNEVRWERPLPASGGGAPALVDSSQVVDRTAGKQAQSLQAAPLLPGWEQATDPSTERTYYF